MYRVGIIGCGMVHTVHAQALATDPRTELVAVCDIISERAEQSARQYHCVWYSDYEALLARPDLDCVHICLPHYLHMPVAIAAMRAGKHVFTEKPMAIKPEDAKKMIAVSEETGKLLGVCFQNRYNTINAPVKRLLDSGRVGRVLGARAIVTWHRDQKYYNSAAWRGTWEKEGGGVLINQAIHTLDMVQWYLGGIQSIKAKVDTCLLNDCIEVEDTAFATMRSADGAVALFFATNCYSSTPNPLVELECEHATIRIEDQTTIRWADGREEVIRDDEQSVGDKAYWGRSHKVIISDFYRALGSDGQFLVSGHEGIRAVQMIDAIYCSNREGRWITI